MTGSCYEPPPVDHHGLMDSQTHRQSAHSYGYAAYNIPVASTMDPSMNMYHHTLWQNSQQALIDDKRGSVIMGQPLPAAAPPAKRKGGRKPKDDPVSILYISLLTLSYTESVSSDITHS